MNVTSRMISRWSLARARRVRWRWRWDGDGGGVTPPPLTGIGPAGGTVPGPNGARVEIPPGALATNVDIKVELTPPGAPALPSGFTTIGQMFAFTPHGTTFAVPVTITLPFDPASVAAGTTPALLKTNAQNQWEELANPTFTADTATAQVTSFSNLPGVIRGLQPLLPERIWEFKTFPGNGDTQVTLPCGINNCRQTGGHVEDFADFGPTHFDATIIGFNESLPQDGVANGYVFSFADGKTYGVFAEAPDNQPGSAAPNGSITRLTQLQSFIKRTSDASLTFTLTKVFIDTRDFNPFGKLETITGDVLLDVGAYKTQNDYFFRLAGRA